MKAKALFCAAAIFAVGNTSAEVLYTFDDPGGGNSGTTAPFVSGGDGTCAWSAANGGSMELSFAAGWKQNVAKLDLRSDPALSAEYDQALANGGTLTFTIIVRSDDILGTTEPFTSPPGWFESMFIANSGISDDDKIWDPQVGSPHGLISLSGAGGFPAGGVQTVHASFQVVADTTATADRIAQFRAGGGWNEIFLGMNSGVNGNPPPPAYAGGKYYVDNFKLVANSAPGPVIVPTMSVVPARRGMHFFNAGTGQYDRQSLRTTGENFSWVGAAGPVEYKFTLADFPNVADMNAVMYLVPGAGVTNSTPDYSEPLCLQVVMIANGSGGGWARVSYKDHLRDSNGPAGHQYWEPDDGTGLGGQLASTNTATMNGTWTLRLDSSTNLTFIAPDGASVQGTLLPATAAKFANPLAVWFGTVPGTLANVAKDALIGGIHITGVPNPIAENFTGTAITPDLSVSAAVPAAVYLVSRRAVWVQWTLPAPSFTLEQSSLGTTPVVWSPATMNTTFDLPGASIRQALFMPDPAVDRMYFRLYKP